MPFKLRESMTFQCFLKLCLDDILGLQLKSLSHQVSISRYAPTFNTVLYVLSVYSIVFSTNVNIFAPFKYCVLSTDGIWASWRVARGAAYTRWNHGKPWHIERALEDVQKVSSPTTFFWNRFDVVRVLWLSFWVMRYKMCPRLIECTDSHKIYSRKFTQRSLAEKLKIKCP